MYEVRVASSDATFLPDFLRIGQFQKLVLGTHAGNMVIS
jgi:hypothetical protein